jgi:hypothetical protein
VQHTAQQQLLELNAAPPGPHLRLLKQQLAIVQVDVCALERLLAVGLVAGLQHFAKQLNCSLWVGIAQLQSLQQRHEFIK